MSTELAQEYAEKLMRKKCTVNAGQLARKFGLSLWGAEAVIRLAEVATSEPMPKPGKKTNATPAVISSKCRKQRYVTPLEVKRLKEADEVDAFARSMRRAPGGY